MIYVRRTSIKRKLAKILSKPLGKNIIVSGWTCYRCFQNCRVPESCSGFEIDMTDPKHKVQVRETTLFSLGIWIFSVDL